MSIDKLDLQSPDLVNENFEKLAALFPNCVTESAKGKAIDFDLLKQELSHAVIDGNRERYRLEWPGKREAIVTANLPTTKTLRPIREDSVDFDNTENLYIEGDNLEVLRILQESYFGKIKMIYIDPPYNTGNDFVYRDNFTGDKDEELFESGQIDEYNRRLVANPEASGRYHSDWLSMMYPRLKLARNLLTEEGVIFISIDDNEVHNLRKVCDEIFGEDNFVEQIVWKNKYGAGAKTVGFISVHEYILCYSKKPIKELTSELDEEGMARFNKRDNKYDTRGGYMTQPLMTNSLGDRPNLMYEIEYKGVKIKPNKQWVWSKERMMQAIENNEVEFNLQKDGSYSVRSKSYLIDENGNMRRGKPTTIYNGPFTQDGTKDLKELFDGQIIFDFSKPSELMKKIISLEINEQNGENDIILDFFSGSATSAHAVMQLNAEDGGNRKYIMVQLPEQIKNGEYINICEIGKERIRRAASKIKEEKKAKAENEGMFADFVDTQDYGFRVYRLADSNMQDVYYRPQDYKQETLDMFDDNIKPDRTPDDLLAQVMLDWGLPLSYKIEQATINGKKVFKVAQDSLFACFDKVIDEAFAKEIAKEKPLRVVFRDNGFSNDTAKINVKQLLKQLSPETEMKVI